MKDNSPAFPTWNVVDITKGMSLRDYFAATALSRLLQYSNDSYDDDAIAQLAYSLADAMMEARK
jgi:hypothetical protein